MALLETETLFIRHLGPFDLKVGAGECVGITGPSGSGKSLLLRAIADLDPHEGSVRLDGKPANDFPPRDWRSQVGYLPSESAWWAETVGEHFQDPAGSPISEKLGLPREAMAWTVARLSTGERQRLALARLLERRPRVLLLDEPTGALDAASVGLVESLLKDYVRTNGAGLAAGIIWVSHDAAQLDRVADRVLVLDNGQLSAAGSS